MEEKAAKIISIIFHPLLIPTYALLLLINANTHFTLTLPADYRYIIVSFVFLSSFALPTLVMLILLKMGKINSLEMKSRHERTLPLFIVAGFFYGTYYLLNQGPHLVLFNIFMLGATLLVIMSLLINYFTKISIHMVALGGMFGTFAGFAIAFQVELTFILYAILLVAGITGFARLKLKAHTQTQVYTGFAMGAIFMLGLFLFL